MRLFRFLKSIVVSGRVDRMCHDLAGRIYLLRHRDLADHDRFPLRMRDVQYFPEDGGTETTFDAHYLYHCSWAARKIAEKHPENHVDIASSVWFSSMVSAFVPVTFYEYQPSRITLSGLNGRKGDLMSLPLPSGSVSSLSCMHVIEHIGLGRYGDPIDPQGDVKAALELVRVLALHGTFLFAVPVGKPRICFNAHRIYSYGMVLRLFPGLSVRSFSLIDDQGVFHENCSAELADRQTYACGCFEFVKEK